MTMLKIEVTWQVEDGYVGKSRPQYTTFRIDKEDWEDYTEQDKMDCVDEYVDDDFREKMCPCWSPEDIKITEEE
jgi:hypothetical protein